VLTAIDRAMQIDAMKNKAAPAYPTAAASAGSPSREMKNMSTRSTRNSEPMPTAEVVDRVIR